MLNKFRVKWLRFRLWLHRVSFNAFYNQATRKSLGNQACEELMQFHKKEEIKILDKLGQMGEKI